MTLPRNKNLIKSMLNIDGWLSLSEGLLLYLLAKEKAKQEAIVEIGSFKGKSTIFMAQALKESGKNKIYAIDPHEGVVHDGKKEFNQTYGEFLNNLNKFRVQQFVIPIRKTSEEANKNWREPISLLFVDGLHEYEYVKKDLELWLPLLTDDGIVVCHDAFSPYTEVFRAVKEKIFKNNKYNEMGYENSIIFARKGKIKSLGEYMNLAYTKSIISVAMWVWCNNFLPWTVRQTMVNLLKKLLKPAVSGK